MKTRTDNRITWLLVSLVKNKERRTVSEVCYLLLQGFYQFLSVENFPFARQTTTLGAYFTNLLSLLEEETEGLYEFSNRNASTYSNTSNYAVIITRRIIRISPVLAPKVLLKPSRTVL